MIEEMKKRAMERMKRNADTINALPISEQAKDLILLAVTMRGIKDVRPLADDLALIGANRCEVVDFLLMHKHCGFDTIAAFAACPNKGRRKEALDIMMGHGGVKKNRAVLEDILSGDHPMLFDKEELYNG